MDVSRTRMQIAGKEADRSKTNDPVAAEPDSCAVRGTLAIPVDLT